MQDTPKDTGQDPKTRAKSYVLFRVEIPVDDDLKQWNDARVDVTQEVLLSLEKLRGKYDLRFLHRVESEGAWINVPLGDEL